MNFSFIKKQSRIVNSLLRVMQGNLNRLFMPLFNNLLHFSRKYEVKMLYHRSRMMKSPRLPRLARNNVRKSTALAIIAVVVFSLFAPVLGFILPSFSPVQAAGWWNEDFKYRQIINITNTTEEDSVYLTLTLDTSDTNKFNDDCSDLRFLNQQGQQIPYHIASGCGTNNTQVQLLFATLPQGDQDIYFYYGNSESPIIAVAEPFNNPTTSFTINSISSETTSPAPIAHWKFDEGYGTTTNSSTSTNHPGTLTNGPTWHTEDMCPSGKCLYFDGVDDYVQAPLDQKLGLSDFSLEVWIKPSHLTLNHQNVLMADASSQVNGHIGFGIDITNDDRYRFYSRDSAGVIRAAYSDTRQANRWDHIVGVRQSQTVYIYINGRMTHSLHSANMNYDKDAQLYIAKDSPSSSRDFFKGSMDNLKVYNYPRTQQQIQQDYIRGIQSMQAQLSNLSNGLVGYWNFDEGGGGTIIDHSGNGFNHTWVTPINQYQSGKYGTAGSFLSGTTHANTPDSNNWKFSNTGGSGSLWFKADLTQTATFATLLHHYTNPGGWTLFMHTNGTMRIQTGTTNGAYATYSPSSYNDNNWHHLAFSIDIVKSEISLYIDGQMVANQTFSGTIADGAKVLEIGGRSLADYQFKGMMDELRIYKRPLNQNEISQLYTHAPKPIAYYDFEEGSGNTVYDKSSNSHNGTWSGTGQRYEQGKLGKSGAFNGSNSRVVAANDDQLNFGATTNFSASAWINLASDAEGTVIMGKRSSGGPGTRQGWLLYYQFDTLRLIMDDQDGNNINNVILHPQILPINEWIHIEVTFDRGGSATAFINGKAGSPVAINGLGDINNTINFTIGSAADTTHYFNGAIDEVKIYNYARTPAQVLDDMQASMPHELNPVGHWKFDEGQGTVVHDSSNFNHNGSLSCAGGSCINPTWYSEGMSNFALKFDDAVSTNNSMVNIPPSNLLSTTDITISTWIRPSSTYGDVSQTIIQNNSSSGTIYRVGYRGDQQRVFLQWFDGVESIAIYSSVGSVPIDKWSYVSVIKSGDRGYFYLNGKLISTQSITSPISTISTSISIGRHSTLSGYEYSGLIDNIKIYNHALTPQQIAVEYNQSSAMISGATSTEQTTSGSGQTATQPSQSTDSKYCVPGSTDYCAKPVAHYDFEEGSGGIVKDISGNSNDGSWGGTLGQQWNSGKSGKAGYFDGSSNYVEIPDDDSLDFGTGEITASAWINTRDTGTTIHIIDKKQGGTNLEGYNLYTTAEGYARFRIANGTTQWSAGAGIPINDGKWHHIAAIYRKASGQDILDMYIDGQLIDSKTRPAENWNIDSSQNLVFGRLSGGATSFYKGALDDIRLYNYARTPAQVAWDYNKGKPIAHYKLDECQGTAIHDSSDNKFHGILNLGSSGITSPGTCNSTNTAWTLGKMGRFNGSMSFDGMDDYINATTTAVPTSNLTVSAWINISSISSTNKGIYSWGPANGCSPSSQYFGVYANQLYFRTGCGTAGIWTTKYLEIGKWYHATLTVDSTGIAAIYYNGTLASSRESTRGTQTVGQGANTIGMIYTGGSPAGFFDGQIDDVQIFNYALTQKQIDVLHNGGAVRWGE